MTDDDRLSYPLNLVISAGPLPMWRAISSRARSAVQIGRAPIDGGLQKIVEVHGCQSVVVSLQSLVKSTVDSRQSRVDGWWASIADCRLVTADFDWRLMTND